MKRYQGGSGKPVINVTALGVKKHINNWQKLVNKYETQLGIVGQSFTPSSQDIEDEFIAYTTSRVVQTDILQFWLVRVAYFTVVVRLMNLTHPDK
jgi:hypothetical protein